LAKVVRKAGQNLLAEGNDLIVQGEALQGLGLQLINLAEGAKGEADLAEKLARVLCSE
jgi:hypothetical protein